MRRQKELNEKTLEKARKEKDRVLYLKEKTTMLKIFRYIGL